jgi:hypothetical protein
VIVCEWWTRTLEITPVLSSIFHIIKAVSKTCRPFGLKDMSKYTAKNLTAWMLFVVKTLWFGKIKRMNTNRNRKLYAVRMIFTYSASQPKWASLSKRNLQNKKYQYVDSPRKLQLNITPRIPFSDHGVLHRTFQFFWTLSMFAQKFSMRVLTFDINANTLGNSGPYTVSVQRARLGGDSIQAMEYLKSWFKEEQWCQPSPRMAGDIGLPPLRTAYGLQLGWWESWFHNDDGRSRLSSRS